MSVETGGPVTGGLLLPKEKEREELMHGGTIYWGLISFRDSHSRDEEVKRFIAERMILLDDKLRSQAETICALLKEAEHGRRINRAFHARSVHGALR